MFKKVLLLISEDTKNYKKKFLEQAIRNYHFQYMVDVLCVQDNVNYDKYAIAFTEKPCTLIKGEVIELGDFFQYIENSEANFIEALEKAIKSLTYINYEVILIDNELILDDVLEHFKTVDKVYFDNETSGLEYYKANQYVICMSFCDITDVSKMYVIYLKHDNSPFLNCLPMVYEKFKAIFQDPSKTLIAHNVNFDRGFVENTFGYDFNVKACHCTLAMHHLLDITERHGLELLSDKYLLYPLKKELKGILAKLIELKIIDNEYNFERVPLNILTKYVAEDTLIGSILYHLFWDRLEESNLLDYFLNYSVEALDMLQDISKVGLRVNEPMLNFMTTQYQKRDKYINKAIYNFPELSSKDRVMVYPIKINKETIKTYVAIEGSIFGDKPITLDIDTLFFWDGDGYQCLDVFEDLTFILNRYCFLYRMVKYNLASPKHVCSILYDTFKFPVLGYTDSGARSTDQETLEKLFQQAKIEKFTNLSENAIKFLRVFKEWKSLASTNSKTLSAIPELLGKDGKIHSIFNLAGTATGRLSSASPNCQNLNSCENHLEFNAGVKAIIMPDKPGNVLMDVDYSGLELRICAAVSGDPSMKQAFMDGLDIHGAMAAFTNGITYEELYEGIKNKVVKYVNMRKYQKTVNFAILYGSSEASIAESLGISIDEVRTIFEKFYQGYPRIKDYILSIHNQVCSTGYLTNVLGMRVNLLDFNTLEEINYTKPRKYHKVVMGALRQSVNYSIQGPGGMLMVESLIKIKRELAKLPYYTKIKITVHDSGLIELPNDPEVIKHVFYNIVKPIMTADRDWMNGVPLAVDAKIGYVYGMSVDLEEFLENPTKPAKKVQQYIQYNNDFGNFKMELEDPKYIDKIVVAWGELL